MPGHRRDLGCSFPGSEVPAHRSSVEAGGPPGPSGSGCSLWALGRVWLQAARRIHVSTWASGVSLSLSEALAFDSVTNARDRIRKEFILGRGFTDESPQPASLLSAVCVG